MGGVILGLEMACWDIIGKALNQPIYKLMGGKVNDRSIRACLAFVFFGGVARVREEGHNVIVADFDPGAP